MDESSKYASYYRNIVYLPHLISGQAKGSKEYKPLNLNPTNIGVFPPIAIDRHLNIITQNDFLLKNYLTLGAYLALILENSEGKNEQDIY